MKDGEHNLEPIRPRAERTDKLQGLCERAPLRSLQRL